MTKYFVDSQGNYIGGFDGKGALDTVPVNAIEVPTAPEHGSQTWDGSTWSLHVPEVPSPTITELVKALDKRDRGDSSDWDGIVAKESIKVARL